jgi:hypothetical protein
LGALILFLSLAGTAQAFSTLPPWAQKPGPTSAPEIDPQSALGAVTLLIGGVAALRGRRLKK